MEQIFKIIKPIRKNQFHLIDFDIEEGTLIKRVMGVSSSMDSVHGILAEIPNAKDNFDIPYGYIEPMYEYKKTIILLHGFNSGPGEKEQQVIAWLQKYNIEKDYNVIAPQLHNNPIEALRVLGYLIQDNYGDITIIGTSLGGFYANYIRASNFSSNIKVHAINPSWNPSETLKREVGKVLVNFKTGIEWSIDEEYLNGIQHLQIEVEEKLKEYKGADYTLHLAKNDELLYFDKILDYLNKNRVTHNIFEYDTNHRFEKMEELLVNIKSKLI